MDLIDDILKNAGLRTRVLGHRSVHKPISLQFPCAKSIGFHVVTQGSAFIHTGKKTPPIQLGKGDLALMARGCDHIVSTDEKLKSNHTPIKEFDEINRLSKPAGGSSNKPKLVLVSGAYQLWNEPIHPFFQEMPAWFILRADESESFDPLAMSIGLLAKEVAQPRLGSERVIQGLLDVMFSLIVRQVIEKNSIKPKSWSHAIQDVQIKQAIEMLHADCSRGWTLEELALAVGLSRAGFAMKFKKAMGDTPLHYLTTVRIQKAMELLSQTELNVERVAAQVGYQDAFGFSKAFKKLTGLPPRDFRRRDAEDKKIGWRF